MLRDGAGSTWPVSVGRGSPAGATRCAVRGEPELEQTMVETPMSSLACATTMRWWPRRRMSTRRVGALSSPRTRPLGRRRGRATRSAPRFGWGGVVRRAPRAPVGVSDVPRRTQSLAMSSPGCSTPNGGRLGCSGGSGVILIGRWPGVIVVSQSKSAGARGMICSFCVAAAVDHLPPRCQVWDADHLVEVVLVERCRGAGAEVGVTELGMGPLRVGDAVELVRGKFITEG